MTPSRQVIYSALRKGIFIHKIAPLSRCSRSLTEILKTANIRFPDFVKQILPNGLTLLLWEDHRLPLLSFEILLKIGAVLDPPHKEGLSAITLSLLRKGAGSRTAHQFAEALDYVGGRFGVEPQLENGLLSLEVLSADQALALDLLADCLRQPAFPPQEFEKKIQQAIAGWRQAKDNPGNVMENYFNSFLFAGHAYGRSELGHETSLANLSRSDVLDFYERYYAPDRLILAVAGDFSTPDMIAQIQERFGDWSSLRDLLPQLEPAENVRGARVLLVDKPDEQQTYFCLGNIGIAVNNPDHVAVDVVEIVLGGRFASWLNSALRVQDGLTYGAMAFTNRHCLPGAFIIASDSQVRSVPRALAICLEQLRRLHQEGIDAETLQATKNFIRGQYPTTLETLDQVAGLACDLEFYGTGPAMINTYVDKLEALTVAEVNRVAQMYFPQDQLACVLAGPAKKLRKIAATYGPVEEIKMSDPGFYQNQ